jgi:mannose-6-phosphate isomerase-like protein (cupin superfamily)
MAYSQINLEQKLSLFKERWSPKIVAQMNDNHFKLVKFQGEFVWHRHDDTDEVFLVLDGGMRIDFRDDSVDVARGEMIVVPKGVEHKPFADVECHVLVIEQAGTLNTGDAGGDKTAANDVWI